MEKKDIVIFGTSKIAEVVYDSICDDETAQVNPVAFCVDAEFYREEEKFDLPVVKFEGVEQIYLPQDFDSNSK